MDNSKKIKMAICILSYNNYEKTYKCLKSCLEQQGNHDFYLIDNVSKDGSFERLKKEFENKIVFLKNEDNLGFAKGNNEIVKLMKDYGYSHTLLLNNDTEFSDSNTVNRLKEAITDNLTAGIIAPTVVNRKIAGDEVVSNSSLLLQFMLFFGIVPHQKYKRNNKYKKIYTAHGCAMVVNNDIFLEVGGFPEELFMYGEETNFCRKITLLKIPIIQCTTKDCIVFHNHELEYEMEPWRYFLIGRNTYFEIRLYRGYKKVVYKLLIVMIQLKHTIKNSNGDKVFIQGIKEAKSIIKANISNEEIRKKTMEYVRKNT